MATDYSLDLKASLDTAEVQEKLNDLSFKGRHATSDLEVAVKRLDNAVQDLTRTWEKQAEAARKAAENAQAAAHAGTSGGGVGGEGSDMSGMFKMAKSYVGGRALGGAGKALEGDLTNEWRVAGGVITRVLGAGLIGGAATAKTGGWGGLVMGGTEGYKAINEVLEARAQTEREYIKTIQAITKLEERRIAVNENAAKIQANASNAIKRERAIQGLDLLSDEELKARRQAAYDTRKHYESNLENGVYSTEGAVREAMSEIKMAKDVSNAINAILKSRMSEEEKERKREQAEQEKENKLNDDAWVRLQKFTREEQLQSFGTELKSMRPGEMRQIGLDLFALQDQLKQQYKKQLEAGDLGGADETEKELEDTKSRLEMIADVLKSTMEIEGLGTYGGQVMGGEG